MQSASDYRWRRKNVGLVWPLTAGWLARRARCLTSTTEGAGYAKVSIKRYHKPRANKNHGGAPQGCFSVPSCTSETYLTQLDHCETCLPWRSVMHSLHPHRCQGLTPPRTAQRLQPYLPPTPSLGEGWGSAFSQSI